MKKEKIPVFVTKEEKAAYVAPKETSVAPKETDAAMVKDAMRYRWLKQQRPMVLSTDNTIHLSANRLDTFLSSHKLFVDGVQVTPAQTLDELVDKAMEDLVWKPTYMDAMSADKGAKATPLYTAPPQRKPLTDEEIKRIDDSTHFHESPDWSLRFARAIEKAHGIKERA